ncbi:MAG TPA: DUF4870 domain-containing protein [Salinimicrobium sp.]|nr:DUF4870 domain-containing protein [Salinimicrobium sp.]
MESEIKKADFSLAALTHLSTFSKYFIPFGNFIIPLIVYSSARKDKFVSEHGRQALNFQISIYLYLVLLICAGLASLVFIGVSSPDEHLIFFTEDFLEDGFRSTLPVLISLTVSGVLLSALLIFELICVITATVKSSEGKYYKYPLSISFIRSSNQSENEQFNNTQKETL